MKITRDYIAMAARLKLCNGRLYWNCEPTHHRCRWHCGDRVKTFLSDGYPVLAYRRRQYYAHILVWVIANGPVPDGMVVGHVGRDREDYRLDNLRLETASNCRSKSVSLRALRNGRLQGVYRTKNPRQQRNPWHVRIIHNGKFYHGGCYATEQAAHDAYLAAKRKLCGEFNPAGRLLEMRGAGCER